MLTTPPPSQSFPVMVGDMDNSGSLNAQVIHQISNRVRSKLAFQVQIFGFLWEFLFSLPLTLAVEIR